MTMITDARMEMNETMLSLSFGDGSPRAPEMGDALERARQGANERDDGDHHGPDDGADSALARNRVERNLTGQSVAGRDEPRDVSSAQARMADTRKMI